MQVTPTTLLAIAAVFAQVLLGLLALLALLALVWLPARRLLGELREMLTDHGVWLAWGVALLATLGSLYFSEIRHFPPCRLCWFQRVGMYPLVAVLLVGALRRNGRETFWYAVALPIFGSLVSVYHLYIEAHPHAESASCRISAPCSTKWINEFGYLTIPAMALTAFASILALLLLSRGRAPVPEPTP